MEPRESVMDVTAELVKVTIVEIATITTSPEVTEPGNTTETDGANTVLLPPLASWTKADAAWETPAVWNARRIMRAMIRTAATLPLSKSFPLRPTSEELPLLFVYLSTHETENWMLIARESPADIVIEGRLPPEHRLGEHISSKPDPVPPLNGNSAADTSFKVQVVAHPGTLSTFGLKVADASHPIRLGGEGGVDIRGVLVDVPKMPQLLSATSHVPKAIPMTAV